MKNPFARTVLRALSLCLLAGFAGGGASETHAVALAPGVDVRMVSDAMLADALAARPKATQAVVCGSSAESTLGVITRRRGRFRCVA